MSYNVLLRFKSVVPPGIQIAAAILVGVAGFSAFSWMFAAGVWDGHANAAGSDAGLTRAAILGLGSVAAVFIAAWLVALGFVYGDAKRRGMPAWLWTLIIALVPNLIGLLLYFALRHPLLGPCGNCGVSIGRSQRFCPACGSEQAPSTVAATSGGASVLAFEGPNQPRSELSLKSFSAGFAVWTGIFLSKSLFAYLNHSLLDSLVLFGFAFIGIVFLLFAHRKETR